ncbi:unnamed protein product [Microthlaspi erraticum]|uniref:RRM domain-containing protein n=1 Tax=Microthlaspi erraticum TaxID=1685480 RepID=A0A6D2JWN6_9BRAS|nr:unnamed protein product [Microthlaspi erraticum]
MQLKRKSFSEWKERRVRRAYVYIRGEGAVEKALKLSGSEMDGHKLVVNTLWFTPPTGTSRIRRDEVVAVTGYDTSLPSKLIKSAFVYADVYGKGAKEKDNMGDSPPWATLDGELPFYGLLPLSERLANPNWKEQLIEGWRKKKMAQAAEDDDAEEGGPSSSLRL